MIEPRAMDSDTLFGVGKHVVTAHFIERWHERVKRNTHMIYPYLLNAKHIRKCHLKFYKEVKSGAHRKFGHRIRYYYYNGFMFIKRGGLFVTVVKCSAPEPHALNEKHKPHYTKNKRGRK